MALKLFHCEECGSEFRLPSRIAGNPIDLTCPVCGEESVASGPTLQDEEEGEEGLDGLEDGEEGEDGEEDEDEDDEPERRPTATRPRPAPGRNPRTYRNR